MSNPARSLFVFGVYLLGLGGALILAPNMLLVIFDIAPTTEVWIRVVGMLLLFLGVYDISAAKGNWSGFIALSVPLRMSVIVFFAGFVLLFGAPKMLLLFAAVDFAFALWTWSALVQERRNASASAA
jgi:uncharacterized membrane protein